MNQLPRTLGLMLLAVLLCAAEAAACPNCKEGLATDPNTANLAQGIGTSIIFMMSMPYLILMGLGSYFYYEIRKAQALKRKQDELAAAAVAEPTESIEQPEEELVGAP